MNTKNEHSEKDLFSTKSAKYQRTYRDKNKKTCLESETRYRNTPEAKRKAAIRYKKWKEANKEKNAEYQKEYNKKYRKRLSEYRKNYNKKHRKRLNEYQKNYNKNPNNGKKANNSGNSYKKWAAKNKEKVNALHKKWQHKQLKTNPLFKITQKLRGAVTRAFKRIGLNKPCNTQTLLGCSYEEAKAHIEFLFQEGMTWENHGVHTWHIDHIRPVSTFGPDEIYLINHISNLQPLWAKENIAKSNKYNK